MYETTSIGVDCNFLVDGVVENFVFEQIGIIALRPWGSWYSMLCVFVIFNCKSKSIFD